MQAFLGVDAGGSHTRAALVSAGGELLGRGLAGPANFRTGPLERARASVAEAVRAALVGAGRAARASPREGANRAARAAPGELEVVAAFIGSAGLEGPGDEALGRELLAGVVAPRTVQLDSDALVAWAGAFAGTPGIVVSAGTGSICLGVTAAGRRLRAGGWGPVFGDEGSAYAVARHGVKAALASIDGRGQETTLLPALLGLLGLESGLESGVESLVESAVASDSRPAAASRPGRDVLELHGAALTRWLYAAGRTQADIASFAPLVEDAAARGDQAALAILDHAGRELAALVAAVSRRWGEGAAGGEGDEPIAVAATGAVLRRDGPVRERFAAALEETGAATAVREPAFPPEIGAVLLAMKAAGWEWPPAALDRLREASP